MGDEFAPGRYHRRSTRLHGYDYTWAGVYFVTLCTRDKECTLSEVSDGQVQLSEFGLVVEEQWLRTPVVRPGVQLDAFVIMPNHTHAIVVLPGHDEGIADRVGAHSCAPLQRPPRSLGSLIAGFKSITTKRINTLRDTPGEPFWQRGYYDRDVRSDEELRAVRQYVDGNPGNWAGDEDNSNLQLISL